jgi:hypothetical protein
VIPHRLDATDVVLRVEPEAAVRSDRPEEPVPAFPRTEQVGRDAGPTGDGADAQVGVHGLTVQTLNKRLTNTSVGRYALEQKLDNI